MISSSFSLSFGNILLFVCVLCLFVRIIVVIIIITSGNGMPNATITIPLSLHFLVFLVLFSGSASVRKLVPGWNQGQMRYCIC